MLRRTLRHTTLCKRLQAQLQGGSREIAKVAHTLNDLSLLTSEVDLTGVDVVDAKRDWILKAHTGVVK